MNNKALFELTMKNIIPVGNKKYAVIPITLLFADFRFQRKGKKATAKIMKLAKNWNPKKMDALRVVPHRDTYNFSVVDGWHRYNAAIQNNEDYVVCEIIDLSEDEDERLIEEATLFATQGDDVDSLTPIEKHPANVLRGVKENVILQRLVDKYKIDISYGMERGVRKENYLSGFTTALDLAKTNEKILDMVFNILCATRWNLAANGLSSLTIHVIGNIMKLHPDKRDDIQDFLIKMFTNIEPEKLFSSAMERYPERKKHERIVLYLEDELVDGLGIDRVYTGGCLSTYKIAA